MSSGLLLLLLCCAGGAFSLVVCRPSSDKRMMVFTILIALAMLAGVGYSIKYVADQIAENAMWSEQ